MATTRKPAASTRKPTTARKTTPRRKTTPKAAPTKPVTPTYSPEQRNALIEAYNTFQLAGLPIPEEVKIVEQWVAEVQAQQTAAINAQESAESERAAKANIEGPWYVRNMYGAPFNLRLDRQTEKRRIELKARGVPGDLHPLKDEDLNDPLLIQNLNIGIIEIIPAGEAQLVVEKQTTNMGTRVHTPLAVLRNENNEPYAPGTVKVETEYNAQGITVAYTDPNQMQGQVHDRNVSNFGGLTRPGQENSQPTRSNMNPTLRSAFVPTGGNPAIVSQQPPMGDNARAKITDDIARRKTVEGPAAGLGDIVVTVAPTQKT